MSSLLAVISPAKLLDDQIHYPDLKCSQPVFIKEAESLVQLLRKLDLKTLQNLLDASPAIAQESKQRFQSWKKPFTHRNAFPAILMFRGEVYRGMQAVEFSPKELQFAHENLRILSGLYGVMRPLDLVMPYRLMMGTPSKFPYNKKISTNTGRKKSRRKSNVVWIKRAFCSISHLTNTSKPST
ncbi:MAG: YaaA family protein [Flavobacteriales bacterium]|nr:YaaA family protein [Flavobacteriales bacterium]